MSQPVLIDLGLIGPEPPAEPAARGRPAAHRVWLAAGIAAVLLGTVSAAAGPEPPVLSQTRIAAGVGHDERVIGDRLYVVTSDIAHASAGERVVSAYRLPDAAAVWHVSLPLPPGSLWLAAAGGAVLVGSDTDGDPVTLALAAGTGRLLWRDVALPIGAVGAGDLALLRRPLAGHHWQEVGGRVTAAVDPLTGRAVWSYRLPAAGQEAFAERGGRLTRSAVGAPSGRVEVRDLGTGRLLAARQLLPLTPAGQVSRFEPWLQVAAGLVFAGDPGGPTGAYDLDTLAPRWTADLDPSRVTISDTCGPVICAVGGDGGIRALDAHTGRLRWSAQRLVYARADGDVLVALAEGTDRSKPPVLQLVDPRTGYPVRDLAPWRLAGRDPHAPPVAIRHDVATMKAWVGLLDVPGREVRTLGVLTGVVPGCDAGRGWVTCRHLDASIGVWHYR